MQPLGSTFELTDSVSPANLTCTKQTYSSYDTSQQRAAIISIDCSLHVALEVLEVCGQSYATQRTVEGRGVGLSRGPKYKERVQLLHNTGEACEDRRSPHSTTLQRRRCVRGGVELLCRLKQAAGRRWFLFFFWPRNSKEDRSRGCTVVDGRGLRRWQTPVVYAQIDSG